MPARLTSDRYDEEIGRLVHRLAAIERLESKTSVWLLLKALKVHFGADAATLLRRVAMRSGEVELRKWLLHRERTDIQEFKAKSGFAYHCLSRNRALVITRVTDPGTELASGEGFSIDPATLQSDPITLPAIIPAGTVEHERSLVYWPIQGEDPRFLVKVASFTREGAFGLGGVEVLRGADQALQAFAADFDRADFLSLIMGSHKAGEQLVSRADALFFYREMTGNVLHNTASNLEVLRSRIGDLELELATLRPEDRQHLEPYVDLAQSVLKDAKRLIKRAQERGAALAPVPVECLLIRDIVRPAISWIREKVTRHQDIEVGHSFGPSDYEVFVDSELVMESMVNVLQNAVSAIKEYASGKRRIFVAVRLIGETVRISVVDSGVGMSPEVVHRLFEPFFTTKRDGTGLGLYNARRILRAAGGDVEIARTVPKKGTTVWLTMPLLGVVRSYDDR